MSAPSSPTTYHSELLITHYYREVEDIVAHYASRTELPPALLNLSGDAMQALLNAFAQRVQLVKSRSQAFEDAHISVYDKALLNLTDNGTILNTSFAITFFCEEMLGICFEKGREHASRAISDVADFQMAMENDESCLTAMVYASEDDQHIDRLINLYHQAKADYAEVSRDHSEQTLSAAKFLRDTAENTIHTLEGKQVEANLWDEIQATYDAAKRAVVILSGGRKRKFDVSNELPKLTENSRTDVRYHATGVGPQYSSSLGQREKPQHRANTRKRYNGHFQAAEPNRFAGNNSDEDHHPGDRGREKYKDMNEFPGRKVSRRYHNRGHCNPRRIEKKQSREGRGPSGIPYGYTRPVDSWHPKRSYR